MKNRIQSIALGALILFGASATMAQKTNIGHFNKVVVNPNIEVVFIHGSEESVSIRKAYIDEDKIEIEVQNNKLKLSIEGWDKDKHQSRYHGTKASLVVTYKNMKELVLKGGQNVVFENELSTEDFELHVYGDSKINMNKVDIDYMESKIYGDNTLTIESGKINNQEFTVFGDCEINTSNMDNYVTKLQVFGDASFDLHVTDLLKVSALGDADVRYTGNPRISKGLTLGDSSIRKAR